MFTKEDRYAVSKSVWNLLTFFDLFHPGRQQYFSLGNRGWVNGNHFPLLPLVGKAYSSFFRVIPKNSLVGLVKSYSPSHSSAIGLFKFCNDLIRLETSCSLHGSSQNISSVIGGPRNPLRLLLIELPRFQILDPSFCCPQRLIEYQQ